MGVKDGTLVGFELGLEDVGSDVRSIVGAGDGSDEKGDRVTGFRDGPYELEGATVGDTAGFVVGPRETG